MCVSVCVCVCVCVCEGVCVCMCVYMRVCELADKMPLTKHCRWIAILFVDMRLTLIFILISSCCGSK